ncbi:MAG: OmpA family protein [Pirellulaceae bacterium]
MLRNNLRSALILSGLALQGVLLGCSAPNAQLASCQEDKEQLLATIREQRDGNRALQTEVASLENRLDESEKELAKIGQPATRLSSRPAPSVERPAVEKAPLPWRMPADSSDSSRTESSGKSGSIENAKIQFEEGSRVLSAAAKRQLDEVAKHLRSKEAADLQVVVSGFETGRAAKEGGLAQDRAQAVADYLDSHGIAGERLSVATSPSRVVAAGGAIQGDRSAVQISVAGQDAQVAGWSGREEPLRR